jgi:hypothetical protein
LAGFFAFEAGLADFFAARLLAGLVLSSVFADLEARVAGPASPSSAAARLVPASVLVTFKLNLNVEHTPAIVERVQMMVVGGRNGLFKHLAPGSPDNHKRLWLTSRVNRC